ncbi:kinase-like protein, partial [Hypoxylon cercidicola]
VHLGDILDGRFEVVHKLGYGGFSTVWLCLETRAHQWRAIKIIQADSSCEEMPELDIVKDAKERGDFDPGMWEANHVSLPLEHFWVEGPNGSHLCEVLSVHGPPIENIWEARVQDDGLAKLKGMAFQIASGAKFLHDRGICHGDLTAKNILVRLRNISHIGKQGMVYLLGEPELETVYAVDMGPAPMAPRYKVVPISTKILGMIDEVVITDFGESFRPSEEEVLNSAIPLQYAAPEAAFCCNPKLPCDIWSLACNILNSIKEFGLLNPVGNHSAYVAFLEAALGPLPEPYRTVYIDQLKEGIGMLGEDWKDWIGGGRKGRYHAYIPEDNSEEDDNGSLRIVSEPNFYDSIKSHYDRYATKYGYKDVFHILLARGDSIPVMKGSEVECITLEPLPDEDIRLLGDLLSKMIKYDPKKRIEIDEVLRHEWFTGSRTSNNSKTVTSSTNGTAINVKKEHEEGKTLSAEPEDISVDGLPLADTGCSKAVNPESNLDAVQLSPGVQPEPIAEPTSSTLPESVASTNTTESKSIVHSAPNQRLPLDQGLLRVPCLPVIQSTDPEIMDSLLDHDSYEQVPTGSTLSSVVAHFNGLMALSSTKQVT